MDDSTFCFLIYTWIGFAIITFPLLFFITPPYGRHTTKTWGKMISNQKGWIIMEVLSLLTFSVFFLAGKHDSINIVWFFFFLWQIHYINRTFIYPMRIHTKGKKMPLAIMFMALFFNIINGFLNGYYFGFIHPVYQLSWGGDPRFIIGVVIFITGMVINLRSDEILIHLRGNSDTGYYIPHGGLFRYISCPNFFGEIIQWFGFATMAWSLPALSFALWTAVNLIPRAIDHHQWYKKTFDEYPKERKAIFPYIL